MKKAVLLTGLMVVSAVAGGGFAYGWYSVTEGSPLSQTTPDSGVAPPSTEAPDILAEPAESTAPPPSAVTELSGRQLIQQQLTQNSGHISVTLDELQLNQLISEAMLSHPQAAQILTSAKSLQTSLAGDSIETGLILNLAKLPRENLSADIQTALDQLTSVAPMLTNRDLYVGIIAKPDVRDGQVVLDQDLSLKLGQFTLPMDELATQMGFSTELVEQHLNAILNQEGIRLETMDVLEQQLVIRGIGGA